MSGELVRYDAMCSAIAAAYEVDEVKGIRDKAMALERYAAQARNTEAERQACEIRLRAERQAGVLLKAMEKAKGSPGNQHTGPLPSCEGSKSLADLGVSYKQSSDWQKLANIPADDFEAALTGPDKPTTTGIIAAYTPSPERDEMKTKALWLWGRLQDFDREGLLDEHAAEVLAVMSDHMRSTTLQLAPIVIEWLEDLINER
jgi:hypothetical protein